MRTSIVHPSPTDASSNDDLIDSTRNANSLARWLRGSISGCFRYIVGVVTGIGQIQQRYPLCKLKDFEEYQLRVTQWRICFVLMSTALPGLLCAIALACIPLQSLKLGITENPGFIAHYGLSSFFAALGAMIILNSGNPGLYHQNPVVVIIAISTFVSCGTTFTISVLGMLWQFPVPFTLVLSFCPWCLCMIIAHYYVMRHQIHNDREFRSTLFSLSLWLLGMTSQVVIYPAFSALFLAVNEYLQLLLTTTFPILKYAYRRWLRACGSSMNEFNEEMAVTAVEISASLYQVMIMQSAPSYFAATLITVVDLGHGVIAVWVYMDKTTTVPRHEIMSVAHVALSTHTGDEDYLHLRQDPPVVQKLADGRNMKCIPSIQVKTLEPAPQSLSQDYIKRNHGVILAQALELLQAGERILLIEYFEVIIPVVNCTYLAVASQLPSAQYNPTLRPLHESPDALMRSLRSLLIYSVLQGLSVVFMILVMRCRYRLSAASHLSFILEYHWWSLQGKLICWLPLFLHFWLAHYGADYSFTFTWASVGS